MFKYIYDSAKTFALIAAPVVLAILPFLKKLVAKALESDSGSWGDLAKRIASRVMLIVVASLVPLLLWLVMMQLAFWGTAVATCLGTETLVCARDQIVDEWPHAPAIFQWLFGDPARFHWLKVPAIYGAIALGLFAFWPFLSVNSNSLHQLYRDRLGSAFLIRRRASRQHIEARVTSATGLADRPRSREVLRRLRNGGQQFVRVEHVHVNDGGQAIIGNVKKQDARG